VKEGHLTVLKLKRLLGKNGWKVERTGNHTIYSKEGCENISVPNHSGDLKKGLVAAILKQAGIEYTP
jgi:predicted RNA binding protein YcfA (HicA-like mRNA interferase family)